MRKPFGSQCQTNAAYVVAEIRAGVLEFEDGHVWRIGKRRRDGSIVPMERHRIDSDNQDGYLQVGVTVDGALRKTLVHHVVLALHGVAVPVGMTVNHIDGDKQNNTRENLEVVSQRHNSLHANRTGAATRQRRRFSATERELIWEASKKRGQIRILARQMGRSYGTVRHTALRMRRAGCLPLFAEAA